MLGENNYGKSQVSPHHDTKLQISHRHPEGAKIFYTQPKVTKCSKTSVKYLLLTEYLTLNMVCMSQFSPERL